jgi:hypothetical protein
MKHTLRASMLLLTLAAGTIQAQPLPKVDLTREVDGALRATIINPLPERLTAWMLDVVDAEGRSALTTAADALEMESAWIPAHGYHEVNLAVSLPSGATGSRQLILKGAVTESGRPIGDPESVRSLVSARAERLRALDVLIQQLTSAKADPRTADQLARELGLAADHQTKFAPIVAPATTAGEKEGVVLMPPDAAEARAALARTLVTHSVAGHARERSVASWLAAAHGLRDLYAKALR